VNNSVSWRFNEGAAITNRVIAANIAGTFNGTLFVAAVVENDGAVNAINPNIQLTISSNQAVAVVSPAADLAVGTYTGRIQFLVCSDQACTARVGGTPLPVTFTVDVLPPVRAMPSPITRTSESGTGVTVDVAVTPGVDETGYSIGTVTPFVLLGNQTPGGFRVTLPSLPVGTYTGSIPLTGSLGSRSTVPVSYTVTAPPGGQRGLQVAPSNLTFSTIEGASSAPQSLTVTEPTWRPGLQPPLVQYAGGATLDWVRLTAVAGGYEVVASAANLAHGAYTANVVVRPVALPLGVQDPFGPTPGNESTIPIALTVGPGFVQPADVFKVIESTTTSSELTGVIPITAQGAPTVTWHATSSDPAKITVTASGQTGANLTYAIDETWLRTQAVNYQEYVATIDVTGPAPLTPVSFRIFASPRFAEVTGVGARVQLANQPTQLVISGRGFSTVDPTARLVFAGATPTSVQLVSDRQLLASFSSLSLGAHAVSISNELGKSFTPQGVVAVTPAVHTYATAPTGASIDALIVDHERGVLYGVHRQDVNPGSGQLFRFVPGTAAWTVDSQPVGGLQSAGVLNDGDVVVTTEPGTLRILDRQTWAEKFSLDLSCTDVGPRSEGGLPVTLDGRVWLGRNSLGIACQGSPKNLDLGSFDPVTRTFAAFPIPGDPLLATYFPGGPDFAMARNGERLAIQHDINDLFSIAPFAYLGASASILRPTPLYPTTRRWYANASSSDDGTRWLLDVHRVLDENFLTIGRLDIADYAPSNPAYQVGGIISPDGTRAYVLTYRTSDTSSGAQAVPPRVYVFPTSANPPGDNPVATLGYFELDDYPGCTGPAPACDRTPATAISLDGRTLFFAGSELFIVQPIPPEGTLIEFAMIMCRGKFLSTL
jgi:hypothetical protein